jgi:predicted CoA-binding protein
MRLDPPRDATILEILSNPRRIALIGASAKPWRDSHQVMAFLLRHGHEVTPVNPLLTGQAIHGRPVVPDLLAAAPLDMVDVFRASQYVSGVVDDAIRLGARIVWLQLGVIDRDAAERARAAGLIVVMDRCPAIEARRLGLAPRVGPTGAGPTGADPTGAGREGRSH